MIKLRNLLILVFVLILLGLSYFLIKNMPAKTSTTDQTEKTIQLLQMDKTKITKMVLSSGSGDLTIEKQGTNWVVPGVTYKLSQDTITSISAVFSILTADKTVEASPQDLAKYGLDKPSYTAKASTSDGKEEVVYIGSQAPISGTYYVMIKGNKAVYAVSDTSIANFFKTLTDLRDKTLTTINSEELTYIKIAEKNKPVIEIKENSGQTSEQSQAGAASYVLTQPYSEAKTVDSTSLSTFLSSLSNIAINSFVDDNPKDLSLYGLDKPENNIIIKDKSNTLNLIIGKDADANSVYFKTDTSSRVYTIDKSVLDSLKLVPFDLIDKFAYIAGIDTISQVTIEKQGRTDTLAITKTVTKAAKTGESDVTTYKFKLNGKDLTEEAGKTLYQGIISLTADSESAKQVAENPEIKMTFTLTSGTQKEVHVNYVPYNDDFYSIFKDGKSELVIAKSKLTALFSSIDKLK